LVSDEGFHNVASQRVYDHAVFQANTRGILPNRHLLEDDMDEVNKDKKGGKGTCGFDRRDVMKLGVAGAGIAMSMPTALGAAALAQQTPVQGNARASRPEARTGSGTPTGGLQKATNRGTQTWPMIQKNKIVTASTLPGYTVHTGPGWKNDSGRAFGNGPMDETTQRMVDFVDWYDAKRMSPKLIETVNYLMLDTLSVWYCAFEAEPIRIAARMAASHPAGDWKCTLPGYGISTTPEMAAFGTAAMTRYTDFNAAPHNNEMLGGILAVGEALHCTGPQIQAAITIAYEIVQKMQAAGGGAYPEHVEWDTQYHGPAVACAVGKLMGLNKDQMANAISLVLVSAMPMYTHIGTASMWKGLHSSATVRYGTWAAMLAKEGMTAPSGPFEERDGWFAQNGPFERDLVFASHDDDEVALETVHGKGGGYKRTASEGNTQEAAQIIVPAARQWCKAEEIESMDLRVRSIYQWQEVCDPPKWDPRNKETADHSLPYNICRNLLDGYIYFDSFTKEKYMDPKVRELMNRMTVRPNADDDNAPQVLTVKKKSGEVKEFVGGQVPPMSHDDLVAKYNKAVEYGGIDKDQAARAMKMWMNLQDCKDTGDAMKVVAKFGNPRPLSDRSPSKYD
jgi:2-methylcitrate dehydratase